MQLNADIQKLERTYLSQQFSVSSKEELEPLFRELLDRSLHSVTDLKKWLSDSSELQSAISENACWRQIKMTRDTENKDLEKDFQDFVLNIEPHIKPHAQALNQKLVDSEFANDLDEKYQVMLRAAKNSIELYREENIPLEAEISVLAQKYGAITGKISVEIEGQEYTPQQARKFLQQSDRSKREMVYRKLSERRLEDQEILDDLFDKLIAKRHQVALNAGFENYRDYMFKRLGRFDYGPDDCYAFHESVREFILPLVEKIYEKKKNKLSLDNLKPWDLDATPEAEEPLKPFNGGKELSDKSIAVFDKLNPFFGNCIRKMQSMKHLDLDSRKGKAPGGYNCPLAESGVPFIFMNAAGTADDVITMMHEGGHAFHSFLCHDLSIEGFKEYPMEMAELASMSMELFTMDHWDIFYPNKTDLKRAKEEQLERSLSIFPWVATIDKFQHWIYTNPKHSREERTEEWMKILNEFYPSNIDVSGLDDFRAIQWQKQLHLYEVPFYYIEYGICQLGALGMWKEYQKNKTETIEKYLEALSFGSTKNLKELWNTAGIAFDFSAKSIEEVATFVNSKL